MKKTKFCLCSVFRSKNQNYMRDFIVIGNGINRNKKLFRVVWHNAKSGYMDLQVKVETVELSYAQINNIAYKIA